MKPRLALLATLALLAAHSLSASPRQTNAPVHRSLETQQERRAQEQRQRESQRPGILLVAPSPNHVIGKVSRVNLEQGFVVGWLQSRYLNLSGQIITRNQQLQTTAVLSVGNARSNRAAGLRIESGVPNVGDEIVVTTNTQPLPGANSGEPASPPLRNLSQQNQQAAPALPAQQQGQIPQRSQRRQPARQAQQQQSPTEQPMLIPASRLRGKPTMETTITVTVE